MSIPDLETLEILHLVENEGLPYSQAARVMGCTKSTVTGVMKRYRDSMDTTDNGHLNGSMPPRWWSRETRSSSLPVASG